MTEYFKIGPSAVVYLTKQPHGSLVKLIYKLEPGQSFLCPHQASSSLRLVKKTNPERVYSRHKDPETGGTWVCRHPDLQPEVV